MIRCQTARPTRPSGLSHCKSFFATKKNSPNVPGRRGCENKQVQQSAMTHLQDFWNLSILPQPPVSKEQQLTHSITDPSSLSTWASPEGTMRLKPQTKPWIHAHFSVVKRTPLIQLCVLKQKKLTLSCISCRFSRWCLSACHTFLKPEEGEGTQSERLVWTCERTAVVRRRQKWRAASEIGSDECAGECFSECYSQLLVGPTELVCWAWAHQTPLQRPSSHTAELRGKERKVLS